MRRSNMSLVGNAAPDFELDAVVNGKDFEKITLSSYRGKYVILFFYPLDFTFVCPTELHAFQERYEDFKALNTEVLACSTDSKFSHQAWLSTPVKKGGIEGVTYPVLSDYKKSVTTDYEILSDSLGVALRGLFIIDRDGIVQHATVNNLSLGRSVDEVYRLLESLIHVEEHGEVCPANWNKSKQAMKASKEGLEDFFKDTEV